jgi:NAD(P)-dependent dehydrogenase (short-subunit alcohol dehydrogenase family)
MTGKTEKVAIITGGSQGIGAGLIAGYRRQGWTVMATARTINLDDARGDGGDPDAAGGVLDRQRPGGRGQAALGQRGPHRGRAPSVCQARPCSRARCRAARLTSRFLPGRAWS